MFRYILKKEFLLIFRDIHALLVLFVMPTLFIIIMSLALKDVYSDTISSKYKVGFVTQNHNNLNNLVSNINSSNYFQSEITDKTNLEESIYQDEFDFLIQIDSDYKNLINSNSQDFNITIHTKPDITQQYHEMLRQLIVESISKEIMGEFFVAQRINGKTLAELPKLIDINYIYKNDKSRNEPTSVQQSVPAWLVFSMFFILIPISNTFINEKNFGTIDRIKSIDVSFVYILLGKIIPYYVINQIQVLLMFLVGIYLLPLLGGDALEVNSGYFLLFCMSSVISIATISFALFIANISKTTEEATSIGGVSNIILAAIGGIMVPKFVMPEFMQNISSISPMSWALDGFLEILVRGGGFEDIRIFMIYLLLFAMFFLTLAYTILNFKVNKR
jgi:ABC-2 type transport system permease protein